MDDYITGLEEHRDFHYSSDAEWDYEGARERGRDRPDLAWIASSRDVWYPNPFYVGPPVRHPEDDRDDDPPPPNPNVKENWDLPF